MNLTEHYTLKIYKNYHFLNIQNTVRSTSPVSMHDQSIKTILDYRTITTYHDE